MSCRAHERALLKSVVRNDEFPRGLPQQSSFLACCRGPSMESFLRATLVGEGEYSYLKPLTVRCTELKVREHVSEIAGIGFCCFLARPGGCETWRLPGRRSQSKPQNPSPYPRATKRYEEPSFNFSPLVFARPPAEQKVSLLQPPLQHPSEIPHWSSNTALYVSIA